MINLILKYIVVACVSFLLMTNILAEKEPLTVGVVPLSKLLISAKFSAPANIISLNHSTISAEITGSALSIKVETGDIVKKGQTLALLDCRSYSLAKKQAMAALQVAKTQFNYAKKQLIRNQNLIKKGIISREIYEKAEAGQLSAIADIKLRKASINTANLAISRCTIKAPFTGQITKRLVQKGQLVTTGTPLFHLLQTNRLEVKATLSPKDVKKLKESPLLEFVKDDKKFIVMVRSIIHTIDETTRTQEVRLSLLKGSEIDTGQWGRIEWSNKERQLPAEFIMRRGDQLGVMLADDVVEGLGKAKFYPLPNAFEGQPATINLPENTIIITLNRYRVQDNDAIRVK